MLTGVFAHTGAPAAPHDAWRAWAGDPLSAAGLLLVAWLYARGRRRSSTRDPAADRRFLGALAALVVASQTPLDAMAHALASAHMVQHVLLVLLAAPLLAWSRPWATLLRGAPAWVRRPSGRLLGGVRRRLGPPTPAWWPVAAWVAHVAALWLWHSASLYDAAVRDAGLHALEHATFLGTAVVFWAAVAGARHAGPSPGARVLLVFTMGLQSVLLAMLLTFATSPWYAVYAESTTRWGLDALADQRLAGAIMWVPAGFVYVAAGLALLVGWLREVERAHG